MQGVVSSAIAKCVASTLAPWWITGTALMWQPQHHGGTVLQTGKYAGLLHVGSPVGLSSGGTKVLRNVPSTRSECGFPRGVIMFHVGTRKRNASLALHSMARARKECPRDKA